MTDGTKSDGMRVIGLTGSIAMGKSTTLEMFRRLGCAVFDSDKAVHDLYAPQGAAVSAIGELYPDAVVNGSVDRTVLSRRAVDDPGVLKKLEAIVHPLVREAQLKFLETQEKAGARIVVLDIPLLFETGRQDEFDCIVVVSAPADVQRMRALQRPGMTDEKLDRILDRQIGDAQKRRRADYVVDTGTGEPDAFRQVQKIVEAELTAAGEH